MSSISRSLENKLFYFYFFNVYSSVLRESASGGGAEREGERMPWNPTWGSIPRTLRSWPELKSRVGCSTKRATQALLKINYFKQYPISYVYVRFKNYSFMTWYGNCTLAVVVGRQEVGQISRNKTGISWSSRLSENNLEFFSCSLYCCVCLKFSMTKKLYYSHC